MAAEGGSKRLLCRFFSRGFCRNENDCAFSHDETTAIPVPETVCWYFLSDSCMYGNNCRFSHVTAEELSNPESSNYEEETNDFYPLLASTANTVSNTSQNHEIIDATPLEANSSFVSYLPYDTDTIPSSFSYPEEEEEEELTAVRQSSEDSGIGEQCDEEPISKPQLPTCVKTYADTVKDKQPPKEIQAALPLCPYAITGSDCVYRLRGEECGYLHGEMCDLCNCLCLHPYDAKQREQHREDCIRDHEREMELSFAVKRSIDKACGICMDVIMEKEPPSERRFGILEKCAHIFCLSCIRKWRQTKQFDNKTIRACPECRVASDFVVPNKYWVDTVEEKTKLIDNYKKNLSLKPCKYFKQGNGECPFAGACFYLHAYPDGTRAEMPPPRARRRQAQDGELETIRDMLLWNYLDARDDRQFLLALDLDDMIGMHELGFFSDSDDDTDFTDYLMD